MENKNILFITKDTNEDVVVITDKEINHMDEINSITLEDAISNISINSTKITETIEEIIRVNEDIVKFDDGELGDIELGDNLTTEISIRDLASLSYNKLNNDKDRIIEKAYEYIRALVNKIISYLKKAYINYSAVNSNHAEIAKQLHERLNNVSLTTVTLNDKIDSLQSIFVIFDKNNEVSLDCLPYVIDKDVTNDIAMKIKAFGNAVSIMRPNDKIIMNTTKSEFGNVRADVMKNWDELANKKFIDEFINVKGSKHLKDKTSGAIDLSDSYLDFNEVATYEPFTTDGKNMNILYQTPDHQLRIMRAEIKPAVNGAILGVAKLKDYVFAMSKNDIGELIKKDIKIIEEIEKDAKVYFRQVKSELGADKGKRNASFNNIVTIINSGLAIASNRIKFGNNILIASRDIAKYLGEQ